MDNLKRIAFAFLATALFSSFNDISAQSVEVEEVVVTATRREESLQDVALSAQALTSSDLEVQQVTEMYDLGDITPGITFAPTIGTGYFVGIRGSATEAIGANSIGSVQTAINGHVVNTTIFGNLGFLDADRIEILAGPQGTLYGRNVTGGLLNVITARPTGDTSGYAKMQYGKFGQTRLSSALNFPITDNVAARFAYGSFVQDGTVKNLHLGTEIDTRDATGARVSVDVDLDGSVLQFTHEAQSFEDSRLNWASQYCEKDMLLGCDPTVKGEYNTGAHYAGTIGAAFGFLTFMQPSKLTDLYANSPRSDDLNETYQDFDPDRYQDATMSTIEWIQARESGDLKVKYSYQTFKAEHTDDNDKGVSTSPFDTYLSGFLDLGGPFEAELNFECIGPRVYTTEQTVECSQTEEERQQFEVNWISDLDGPINYTLGMYAHDRAFFNDYMVQSAGYSMNRSFDQHPYSDLLFGGALDGFGGINFWQNFGGLLAAGLPAVLGQQITVNQLLASITSSLVAADAAGVELLPDADGNPVPATFGPGYMRFTHPTKMGGLINSDHGKQKSSSMFGEVYYDLDDTTKLTFGLRYDNNDPEYSSHNALGDANAAGARMGLCARANGGVWTRDGVACGISYGTQKETAVTGKLAIQKDLSDDVMVYALYSTGNKPGGTSPNNAGDILPYNGTDSTNIEFGLRSVLRDGKVLLNATLFQADFKDAHNSMIYGLSAITNTIDYTHTGLELQSRFLLGDNTSLDFNLFALDSEIGNDQALYDPINPFGLTSNDQVNFARDTDGLAAILNQAFGLGVVAGGPGGDIAAGVADAIGSAMAFCNWGLYASVGVFGKCQGTFVVDPRITSLPGFAPVVNQDIGGNRMPATTELDYNIALNQSFTTPKGSIDTRLTYAVKGDIYVDLFNTERGLIPERTNFDFVANYTPNDGDWYAGVYAQNLADKRYVLSYDRGSEVQGGVLNATLAMPRTYGVSFGINF
jgi:outer membrane receptor protein involved in Fe transport